MLNRYIFPVIFFAAIIDLLFSYFNSRNPIKMSPKPKLNVQNFPRPPLLEQTSRHLQVKWRGQTIADTKDAFWVLETYHPPSNRRLRALRITQTWR